MGSAAVGVGTRERSALILVLLLLVVAIERTEIADVEAHLVGDVPSTAKAEAVAVAGKRGVLLVAVAKTVVGTLTTTADGELIVDVVLSDGRQP